MVCVSSSAHSGSYLSGRKVPKISQNDFMAFRPSIEQISTAILHFTGESRSLNAKRTWIGLNIYEHDTTWFFGRGCNTYGSAPRILQQVCFPFPAVEPWHRWKIAFSSSPEPHLASASSLLGSWPRRFVDKLRSIFWNASWLQKNAKM